MSYDLPGYDAWKGATPDLEDDSEEHEPGWDESDYLADRAERDLDTR
jgi:hypothetical protein